MLTVTTSWDDGDVLDLRVAELLEQFGMKGTFYVPRDYWGQRLAESDIKKLSEKHEVGAHTLSHIVLKGLPRNKAEEEIRDSKAWLEHICGQDIDSFCYPRGRFSEETSELVKAAGFKTARTTELGMIDIGNDPFRIPTTISVYPMPFKKTGPNSFDWKRLFEPLFQRGPIFRELGVPIAALRSWESLACAAFDIAHLQGSNFHLWGHSWEIEKYGLWDEFQHVCAYISGRSDCRYVTNGELV